MCRNVTYAPGKRPTFTATARTWDLNNSPVKIRFTIHRATDNTTIATYTSSAVPSGYTATTVFNGIAGVDLVLLEKKLF